MKSIFGKMVFAAAMSLTLAAAGMAGVSAETMPGTVPNGDRTRFGQNAVMSDTASEIVYGTATNSAAELTADTENAVSILITDENSHVTVSESGTYLISGSAADGSITVKKGTAGVVLILRDLELTCSTGAPLSVNKDCEVQIVIDGSVSLNDCENPEDEAAQDAETADKFDGAAIRIKAGSAVYLTGSGTLNVNGNAKNGVKTGDESSLIIDGENLTVNVTAANDGINANWDLTILRGTVNVSAADDALHADRILTVGSEGGGTNPSVTVLSSTEGLEGTVVNIHSGNVTVTAADDAINAANSDGKFVGQIAYAVNVTGGSVTTVSRRDGLDSNGNVNLVGGTVTIQSSAANGGDAGIDYDGQMYVSADAVLNNANGVAGPDGGRGGRMDGQMGMPGQMWGTERNGGQRMPSDSDGRNGWGRRGFPDFGGQNGGQMTPPDSNGENGHRKAPRDTNRKDGTDAPSDTDAVTQATKK